eukprot:SAG11_NODE_103_length_16571_cov_49.569208_18_plen_89_part_00
MINSTAQGPSHSHGGQCAQCVRTCATRACSAASAASLGVWDDSALASVERRLSAILPLSVERNRCHIRCYIGCPGANIAPIDIEFATD